MTIWKLIFFINIISASLCFLNFPQPKIDLATPKAVCNNCGNINERTLYRNYLLGLRKTRKLLSQTANTTTNNINALTSILDFTSEFVGNNSVSTNQTVAKHIIMGNIILDVSNIKEIHIKTENDVLIVELDKKKTDAPIIPIVTNINNVDALINSLSLVAKILNIN